MWVRRSAETVRVLAPAKLNLFFEVLARRADGFHEIESLMTPVALFDELTLVSNPTGQIRLHCQWAYATNSGSWETLPPAEDNLVYKALVALRQAAGVSLGATVELFKRIPSAAGLGGGSSDAAAALIAANLSWHLGWSTEQLQTVAAQIGSDVPFFLTRGPAIARGRGEQLEPVDGLPALPVVIVKPAAGLSTAAVYRACRPATPPECVENLVRCLREGQARACGGWLHNRLIPAAETLSEWPVRLRQEFARTDVCGHQMSGSGTSYYGICRSVKHARRIAAYLRGRNLGMVFATVTQCGPAWQFGRRQQEQAVS